VTSINHRNVSTDQQQVMSVVQNLIKIAAAVASWRTLAWNIGPLR